MSNNNTNLINDNYIYNLSNISPDIRSFWDYMMIYSMSTMSTEKVYIVKVHSNKHRETLILIWMNMHYSL